MKTYQIAGLTVRMESFGRTVTQAEPYLVEDCGEADITIRSNWENLKANQPHLSDEDCEYLSTGSSFYTQLLKFDGMMVHASAVVVDGRAYLFSGPCGTGKSTHTKIWRKLFGDERAKILNDDKPALRLEDGQWFAYGTPWSGKTDQNLNIRVPLAGICFLKQASENRIRRLSQAEAVSRIITQTVRKFKNVERLDSMLSCVEKIVQEIPVFELENRPEPAAAQLSYETMRKAAEEMGL